MPTATVELVCDDIQNISIENALVVLLNFTLQFLPPETRLIFLTNIYNGLRSGVVLILSEKLRYDDEAVNQLLIDLHHEFKHSNGYSDLEIGQKRAVIENVLIPDSLGTHKVQLTTAGVCSCASVVSSLKFSSLIALKA